MPSTPDYETVLGQTEEDLQVTLTKNGLPMPLAGATVVLLLQDEQGVAQDEISCVVVGDGSTGEITYDWENGYPSSGAGDYGARYRVTLPDGDVTYFPSVNGRYLFRISPV